MIIDVQLLEVLGAFEEVATQHAMRMIDEYHLQPQVSDKNVRHGGVPGAMLIDGMILHFACDYDGSYITTIFK